MTPDRPYISVVIPLLNEEGSLRELHGALTKVLGGVGRPYEILFVNDGSTDASATVLDDLAEEDPSVGVIHFRRNFGKAAALDAGFKRAGGEIIFTMDADLQDDPEEIPNFLAKLDEGFDLVSGWKKKRHDPLGKTMPSKLFNFTVSSTSGLKLHDFNCGFKAYRRECVENLELYGELHRYVPVLVHWQGFRVAEMAVTHHPRQHGVSKYGVERMLKGFFDLMTVLLITRYRARPLHLFGLIGFLLSAAGFGCLAYLTVLKFLGESIGGRPLLMLGLLLVVVGVQLGATGLLGEMINASRPGGGETYNILSFTRPRGSSAPSAVPEQRVDELADTALPTAS
jgi:glycosyltransferase involved in cell wall biosynthesis